MQIELCDLCKKKEPNRKFKIKQSRKNYGLYSPPWSFYERIVICDECGEKLFGIKSNKTMMKECIEKMTGKQQ